MWHMIDALFGFDVAAINSALASIRPVGNSGPRHRSAGCRSHRRWKRSRAAGISKRVRA